MTLHTHRSSLSDLWFVVFTYLMWLSLKNLDDFISYISSSANFVEKKAKSHDFDGRRKSCRGFE